MIRRNRLAPKCPHCHKTLDGVANATGRDTNPGPGDLSICIYCFTILQFTEEGLKVVSIDELSTMAEDDPGLIAHVGEAWYLVRQTVLSKPSIH